MSTNLENSFSTIVKSYVPLTEHESDQVAQLAAAGMYGYKIAEILQKDKRLFMLDFHREGTDIHSAYNRGLLEAKAVTNQVTLDNAQKGNITAKQMMEKIWEEQKLENLKHEIFNSE